MNQVPDVSLLQLYLRITSRLEEFNIPKYKTPTRKDKVKFLLALVTDTLQGGNYKLMTQVEIIENPYFLPQRALYSICSWDRSLLGSSTYSQLANCPVILFP